VRLCGGAAIISTSIPAITATTTIIIIITTTVTWVTPAAIATVTSWRFIITPIRICSTLIAALVTAIIVTAEQLLIVSMTTAGHFSTHFHARSSDLTMPVPVATATRL